MVRIISKSLMALALAGFLIPSITSDADAGRRYKSSGKYHGKSLRRSHRRGGGFLLRFPAPYLNGRAYQPTDFSNRSYRGGPKIIDVQKTLRARRKREIKD
jgi:hypothetical protein